MQPTVWIVAAAFAGMGVVGLVKPQLVMDPFGVSLTSDGRNEVRAVYGGFGLAVAGALVWATRDERLGPGIILAVALALAGMAAGRAVAALIERPGKWPLVFLALETIAAIALYQAR